MNFIYSEQDVARRVGLSRKQLYGFRTAEMREGVHFVSVTHESRKKTALSEAGLELLVAALASGGLTRGEPVTVGIAELRENALLSEMPTGSGENKPKNTKQGISNSEGRENPQKTSPPQPRRIRGLLPCPPGVETGGEFTALLIVHKHPSHVSNKHTLVCRLKPGQMAHYHEKNCTDAKGLAYCRVKSTEKFVLGMEVPARFDKGNVWDCTRPCPRRRGRW